MGQDSGQTVGGTGARTRARRRLILVAVTAAFAAVMLCSSSAQALVHQGHVYKEQFGAEQSLSQPSSLAVNDSSGDVYVLDTANNRVMVYGPEHKFIEAWGYGVKSGGSEKAFEHCKAPETCKPGAAGYGKEQFKSPVAIAVDNESGSPSKGDVYVLASSSPTRGVVDEFTAAGVFIRRLITKEESEEFEEDPLTGVAIGTGGAVWVEREGEGESVVLSRFSASSEPSSKAEAAEAVLNPELLEGREGSRPVRPGFAVDSQGDMYITYEPGGPDYEERLEREEEIAETEKERKKNKEPPAGEKVAEPCEAHTCYVGKFKLVGEGASVEAVPLIEALEHQNTTGVAVDLASEQQASDDVYLDNVTSIAAFTSSGSLIQRFGSGEPEGELKGGRGLAVDGKTNVVFAADAAAGRVDVYTPEPPGPPTIEPHSLVISALKSTSAELQAQVDPHGLDTHYYFEYGTAPCSEGGCASVPAKPGADIGAGFGDQTASAVLEGLSPETVYHYRVIAANVNEKDEQQVAESAEAEFTTQAAAEVALPDGRAWELVSPAEKDGVAVEGISHEQGLIQAAADGSGITYLANAPLGEGEPAGNRAPEPAQILSRRQASNDWSAQNLTTENQFARGIKAQGRREYQAFSANLSLAILAPEEPLSKPKEPSNANTIYLRHNETCAASPNSCYTELASEAQDSDKLAATTSDLSHVAITAGEPLKAGPKPNGVYEWSATGADEGELQLVSFLPGEVQASGRVLVGTKTGVDYEGARHALSEDGSRLVFTVEASSATHLYQREQVPGQPTETLQVDAPNTGVTPTGAADAVFQAANEEGTQVFFTSEKKLTTNAHEGVEHEGPAQLYVFEPQKPAGERLTDLSPDVNSAEVPAVQGGAIISDNGAYAYFVANGVLTAGAEPGACGYGAPRGEECDLYVAHDNGGAWEAPKVVGRLRNEDAPDWGSLNPGGREYGLNLMTSRTSPNGEWLAFMSDNTEALNGYDNSDAHSHERDEEVYLYNAPSGHLVCASCNPSGAAPVGVHDVEAAGEGRGLLVDRPETWSTSNEEGPVAHWLAANIPGWTGIGVNESYYQSRYLSNEGRLFFNSSSGLVGQDHNVGTMDVYEYEPTGLGSCEVDNTEEGCVALVSSGKSTQESAFMDASAHGEDVFFLTSAQLSKLDTDNTFDVYDARICTEGEPCLTPSAPEAPTHCGGEEECRPGTSSLPPFMTPASETPSGSGNIAVLSAKEEQPPKSKPKPKTRAQRLAAALKICRAKYKAKSKKGKRVACEKQAQKKYGAKKASKAGRASAKSSSRGRSAARARR